VNARTVTRERGRRAPAALAVPAMALTACLAGLLAPPAGAKPSAKPSLAAALPGTYIASYKKARSCKDMVDAPWINWLTYAQGKVSDEWALTYGGRKASCGLAKSASRRLIESRGFADGAGFAKIDWQGYAMTVGDKGTGDEPIGRSAPPGWKCFALPSQWGTSAWTYAEIGGLGAPDEYAFSGATGSTAGGGFCVTGAKAGAGGVWHGGSFLAWQPDTRTCGAAYLLRQNEDAGPEEPEQPSYADAQVWASYEKQGC
jgi:hypothetical protein